MSKRHEHELVRYGIDEEHTATTKRHEKKYGHQVTKVCRHRGRRSMTEYCETCGNKV